jgi:crotonobetaine/carnitine-CoA ligase
VNNLIVGERTLPGIIAGHRQNIGDKEFILYNKEETSYAEIDSMANKVGAFLKAKGVRRGDQITLLAGNRPDFFTSLLAVWKLGAVCVPTNTGYTPDELAYSINHSDSVGVITQKEFLPLVESVRSQCPGMGWVVVSDGGSEEDGFSSIVQHYPDEPPDRLPAPDDMALIMYSSGTTTRPKGVMINHESIVYSAEVLAKHLYLTPEDRAQVAFPLFHANSLFFACGGSALMGGSFVLLPRLSISRWWTEIIDNHVTWNSGLTGSMIRLILQNTPEEGFDNPLRVSICGMLLATEELHEFERRFNVRLAPGWGMTETVALVTATPLYGKRNIHGNFVGRVTLGQEAKVLDEDGKESPFHQEGELVVKCPSRMLGYYKDPKTTEETVRDGWIFTGDICSRDEEGFFHFVDRIKDVIKPKGENVAAAEIERVLNENDKVLESYAIGIPDTEGLWGERIKVFLVLKENETMKIEEMQAWCKAKLADFKIPSFMEVVQDAELPRTAVGKVKKNVLRAKEMELQNRTGGS